MEPIEAIIPTIVIPFAFLGFLLSAVAAFIAGLFGIKLKTEGPRRLLEVLLKPRVLFTAAALNLVFYGGYKGYQLWDYSASPVFWIEKKNPGLASDRVYKDVLSRAEVRLPEKVAKSKHWNFREDWRVQLPSGIFNSATLSGDSIFVGSRNGYVYEIDQESGKTLRKIFIGTMVTPYSLIWKDHIFVGEGVHETYNARIYKFSLRTGRLVASFQTNGHTEGSPLITFHNRKPYLLVSAGRDGVYALNPENLEKRWHIPTGHTDSGFLAKGGIAYFSTGVERGESVEAARHAYAIDIAKGEVLWKTELAMSGWMPPVFHKDSVCFGLGELYFPRDYGQVACYNRHNGEATLSFNTNAAVTSLLEVRNSKLIFGDQKGKVCVFDLEKKQRLWCQKTSKKKVYTYASPSFISDKLVAYPSYNNGLFIFDLATGKQLAHWKPKKWNGVFSRLSFKGDRWFLSDYKGGLRRFGLIDQSSLVANY